MEQSEIDCRIVSDDTASALRRQVLEEGQQHEHIALGAQPGELIIRRTSLLNGTGSL